MNTSLWVMQISLAIIFILAGTMITILSKDKLMPKIPWVTDFSPITIKLNGISKILGGICLIIPWWTGILPLLTPLSATGFCLIMLLASIYNIRKKDFKSLAATIIIFLFAGFIAFYRF